MLAAPIPRTHNYNMSSSYWVWGVLAVHPHLCQELTGLYE